jgi:preprotein translocase SecF subunit
MVEYQHPQYRFDFLKYRPFVVLFTLALIGAFIGTYVYRVNQRGEAFNYSVDFTGGTQALFKFSKPVLGSQVRDVLDRNGWKNPVLREFSAENEIIVRVKEFENNAQGVGARMQTVLNAELPDTHATLLRVEGVGAGMGEELRWKSMRAVLIALIAMLLYIAFTFWSTAFAVGAVVALCHDAFVMVAVILFLDHDISIDVIGAILAVLGYSINDTIVIFSQIRTNLVKMRGQSLHDIVNTSLNQTLRRTLLTSFSTALTVGSMFFLGGEGLRDFSLTLLVGIIFGTYSSIYIASPIMMMLYKEPK